MTEDKTTINEVSCYKFHSLSLGTDERSMSPLVNSQKIQSKLYENNSRITSYENNWPNPLRHNSTMGNAKIIHTVNTLNKSTLSGKMSKKANDRGNAFMLEHDNIEDMHGVLVAFFHASHGLLTKVEEKDSKNADQTKNAKSSKDANLLEVWEGEDIEL